MHVGEYRLAPFRGVRRPLEKPRQSGRRMGMNFTRRGVTDPNPRPVILEEILVQVVALDGPVLRMKIENARDAPFTERCDGGKIRPMTVIESAVLVTGGHHPLPVEHEQGGTRRVAP